MNILEKLKSQPLPATITLILIASLPFERIPSYDLFGITVRLSSIFGLILIALCIPLLWKNRGSLFKAPWAWLGAFLTVSLVSAAFSLSPAKGLKTLAFTAFVFAVAWAVSVTVKSLSPRAIAFTLVTTTVVSILFGIYQFFGDLIGLPTSLTGLRDAYTKSVFGFPRIQSTALEPLYYANFLLIPGALATFLYIYKRSIFGILLFTILTTVWLTLSRGGYYAFGVILFVGIVAAILTKRYVKALFILLAVILSGALAVGLIALGSNFNSSPTKSDSSTSIKRFQEQSTNTDQGESVEGRAFSRNLAIDLFQNQPILGVGPGNFGSHAQKLHPERYPNDSGIVNNETLEILAETGVAGFAAILGFGLALLLRVKDYLMKVDLRQPSLQTVLIIALTTSTLATAIQYQAFSTLYITHVWVAIGILIGLIPIRSSQKPITKG